MPKADWDRIEEAIQASSPPRIEGGPLLTAWVVVSEWMAPDGRKWLSRMQNEGGTVWLTKGMLFDALHGGDWETNEDED